uniref:Uncharacterized protein n=1 Tax=viral metagenome TaxID=1070528 RepID=A0A6M3L4U9_9ZZZZ
MDLEKEIKLLKEKIELLEKVKELQDMIKANEKITYVPYPVYPWEPWQPWRITYTTPSDNTSTSGNTETLDHVTAKEFSTYLAGH